MRKMKKVSMFGMIAFCMFTLQAQIPGYVQGDENYTLTLAFHNIDTLLVVVPHNYIITDQEKTDIENYVFWDQYQKKPVYVYKTETELLQEDEARNLQFYGPFCDFQLSAIHNIPIKQAEGGFSFNNELFTRPTDSFFYLNDEATRLYTCSNSTQMQHPYANYAAGYFPFYIFRGNDVYLSGNCSNNSGKPQINNITKMREQYFETIATHHFDFEIAITLCTDSLRHVILEEADQCLENICAVLNTDTSSLQRMTTYMYSSMLYLQQFLSMSPKMTIYGKSFGPINHVSTFDMAVFNHELAHTVIGRKIGVQSNSFFCEGFAVYTGYFMEESTYTSDFDSTILHLDLLTEENITGPDHQFYSQPPMYPIAGVFIRFIVDKIGIEIFKGIYAQYNIENAFSEKGYPLASLIAEFKSTIGDGRF